MRGGNRQRPRSEPGHKPPRPPRGLTPVEADVWRELAAAVAALGTYRDSDYTYFRLTVKTVAEAQSPADMPPTARARVLQAAGAMLSGFGLSPLARERIRLPPEETPMQQVLRAMRGGKP